MPAAVTSPPMTSQHFRAGVVALIERDDGTVLAFERQDAAGQWQLPQGGIADDESPRDAVWRELGEETGLGETDVELVRDHGEWVAYEWPPELRRDTKAGLRLGQIQRWFLFRPRTATLRPHPDGREFIAYRWVERRWLIDHVVDMRRAVYARMLEELK